MTFSIAVKTRTEKSEKIREQGLIPAVLYGSGSEAKSVSVDGLVFEKLYKEAGESNLIDLTLDDNKESSKILVQDVQVDPVRGNIIHADFMLINMNKEMFATLPVNYVGESAAIKELGGTLITGLRELNIKCLPKDLVGGIDFDLSILKTFEDVVHVGELVLPGGITATDNPDTVVAKVVPPLTEDQLKAMEETSTGTIADVEVEGGKKDGAEAGAAEDDKKEEKKGEGKEDKPAQSDKKE